MPGLFGDAPIRLLRENWQSLQELAEECYAVFATPQSQQLSGPITITNNTDQPAVTINQNGNAPGTVIQFSNLPPGATPLPVYPGGSSPQNQNPTSSGSVLEVTITAIAGDTLTVSSTLSTVLVSGTATVAKPPLLRVSQAMKGRDGETYSFTGDDGQNRTATFGSPSGTEMQQVVPLYEVGDIIYVTQLSSPVANVTPTTSYIDLNVDARAWASILPSAPS